MPMAALTMKVTLHTTTVTESESDQSGQRSAVTLTAPRLHSLFVRFAYGPDFNGLNVNNQQQLRLRGETLSQVCWIKS